MKRYGVGVAVGLLGAVASAGILVSMFNSLAPFAPVQIPTALDLPALTLVGFLVALALGDYLRVGIALAVTVLLSTVIIGAMLAAPGFDADNYTVPRVNFALTQAFFALFLSGIFVTIGAVVAMALNVYVRKVDGEPVGVNDGPATTGWSRRSVRDQAGERP